jgi:hypothetical protein
MATNLKKDLQDVKKALNVLSKKVEKIISAADKPGKTVTKAKPAKKAVAKKEKRMTAPEILLNILNRSRKEIAIGALKEKSGFQGQKLYNTLSILKKQGKIKNPSKGIYAKV